MLWLVFVVFIIIIYLLITSQDDKENKPEERVKELAIADQNHAIVKLRSVANPELFLSIQDTSLALVLNNNPCKFEIIKHQDGICLKSKKFNKFVMIKYTPVYNQEYDVNLHGDSVNNICCFMNLELYNENGCYILTFFNGFYVCIDKNNRIFASKDKTQAFLFKIKRTV